MLTIILIIGNYTIKYTNISIKSYKKIVSFIIFNTQNICFVNIKPVDNVYKSVNNSYKLVSGVEKTEYLPVRFFDVMLTILLC